MKQKFPTRQLFLLAVIGYFVVAMATFGTSCKHPPLFDDDGLTPVDSMDTTVVIDTFPTGTPCDPDSVYFETDVLPILISSCAKSGCHNAASHEKGVILDSYANVVQTGDVRPFDLNGSDLYEVITETDPDKRMPQPPNAPLTQAQIQLIAKWINQGAQDLHCDPAFGACDTTNISFSQTLKPILNFYCVGCHSGAGASGNVHLDAYAGVKSVAQNGKLLGVISWAPGFQKMPQGGNQLDDCKIAKFKTWIDSGAPEN
ncbi:MAG: hypothetical protein GC192_00275 [Bacteroidetes bacterium]|nr:hypothetical protein [Bacteroidota bacterium]